MNTRRSFLKTLALVAFCPLPIPAKVPACEKPRGSAALPSPKGISYRGEWNAATTYNVGDVIRISEGPLAGVWIWTSDGFDQLAFGVV